MSTVEHFDVVLVGAGLSGIGTAHHLQERCPGKRFVILEEKMTFGGTWHTHTYPGIRSDSDLYTFGYEFKPWTGAPIATTSSISGILASNFFGPYAMSKHAMEAFTDALAAEMQKFGVHVSAIEPGNYNSKIGETLVKRMKAKGMNFENSYYKEEWDRMMGNFNGDRSQYKDPDEVAAAVELALFSDKPKRRYMVVPSETEARWTITQIMREMAQLNENQAYKYDREALIAILDQVLAETEQ